MHYAMGYCFGAGMPFGTWLGDAIGRGILGEEARLPLELRDAVQSALSRAGPGSCLPTWLEGKDGDRGWHPDRDMNALTKHAQMGT